MFIGFRDTRVICLCWLDIRTIGRGGYHHWHRVGLEVIKELISSKFDMVVLFSER